MHESRFRKSKISYFNPYIIQIFKKIDKNFDGKIDFEEFSTWWELSKGTAMEKLVMMKLKGLRLIKKAKKASEKYGDINASKYGDDGRFKFKN